MANNTLETRILICNDTEANWGTSTKVLLKGEMGILFPTDTTKEPILKVGNGIDTFDNLKALNIRASDLKDITDRIGDLSTLKTTEKTSLVKAINELVDSIKSAGAVSIDTTNTTEGYAKSYTVTQGIDSEGNDIVIGVIDIPKDMVVSSGQVVTFNIGDDLPSGVTKAGTYIELTIANATSDKLYINVESLATNYTVKANATQIQLAIDATTREISATIVDGSVNTDALADGVVTTVKIADGAVTKGKLEQDLQDSIDKANAAVSSVKVNGTALTKDANNTVDITEISTDILKNGENILVLDGGNSTTA